MSGIRSVTFGGITHYLKDKDAVKSASYVNDTLALKDSDGATVSSLYIPTALATPLNNKIKLDIVCTDNTVYSPENFPTTASSYALKKTTLLPKSTAHTPLTSYEDAWNDLMVKIFTTLTRTTDSLNDYNYPNLADYLDIRLKLNPTPNIDSVPYEFYPSGFSYVGFNYVAAQDKYNAYGQVLFTIASDNKIIELKVSISFNFTWDNTTFTDGTYTINSVSKTIYGLNTI